jgi:CBS domain-containing protein
MTHSVGGIMSREPGVVHVDHSLAEAAKRMKEMDVGALPVVDGDELVGFVTDRNPVVRGMARRGDPATASVADAMTRHAVFRHEAAPIGRGRAASPMARERVRRLPVVDRDREVMGILSLADIARDESSRYIAAAATGTSQSR